MNQLKSNIWLSPVLVLVTTICFDTLIEPRRAQAADFLASTVPSKFEIRNSEPLLAIDLNRDSIIERIVNTWSSEMSRAEQTGFRSALKGLRADQLLIASLAGSLDHVLETIVQNRQSSNMSGHQRNDRPKALGEIDRDLVYTPIAPCNLMDTRAGVSPTPPETGPKLVAGYAVRDVQFTGRCDIPSDASAVSAQFTVENLPSTGGVIFAGKSGVPGGSVIVSWNSPVAFASGSSVIPLSADGRMQLQSANVSDLKIDVNGYLMPASRNGDGLRVTNVNAISPNMTSGAAANSTSVGVRGATIAGGGVASGSDPDYGGDAPNRVTDHYGFVGGGFGNRVGNDNVDVSDAGFATVTGGRNNTAGGSLSAISGGLDNRANGYISTVAGGEFNQATSSYAVIAGGQTNLASGDRSAIVGGQSNTAGGNYSAIAGGASNSSAGLYAFVGAGQSNASSGAHSSAAGGFNNLANGAFSSISGGQRNKANGQQSTVTGGDSNIANGDFGIVVGGANNSASGRYSLAGGLFARTQSNAPTPTIHDGTFIWSDSNAGIAAISPFHSSASDQFAARSRGGVVFKVGAASSADDVTPGCSLPAGGAASWSCSSDRNLKEGIAAISPKSILDKVVAMPLSSWQFRGTPRRHIGPMAQDFHAAFGLGADSKNITTSDVSGVALAAIQGLNQKLAADGKLKDQKIAQLEIKTMELDLLKRANVSMQAELAVIKKRLGL